MEFFIKSTPRQEVIKCPTCKTVFYKDKKVCWKNFEKCKC